jgi:hypothetical protein
MLGRNLMYTLEQKQRFSASCLWSIQRAYFKYEGMEAWGTGSVPYHITTNPFIARGYAKVILGFLRDNHLLFSATEGVAPLYIVELGAGSGCLAFHLLDSLIDMLQRVSLKTNFKYILTDFSLSILEMLREHPQLQQYVEQGILDFALFDAEYHEDLLLMVSGDVLLSTTITQPIILIANYFFDSIPQDCFTIQDSQLMETLLTISSPLPNLEAPIDFTHTPFQLEYHHNAISTDYYDDIDFNRILQDYQEQLLDTTFLFPHTALRCLRYFYNLSKSGFLLLSGDKGYVRKEDLLDREPPGIEPHKGAFSMMVNYHAIGEYIRSQRGIVLDNFQMSADFNVLAFLAGPHPRDYPETTLAFYDAMQYWSPDDLITFR